MPNLISDHVLATYWGLRLGMSVLGASFPFLLALIGLFLNVAIQKSMSAYYHVPEGEGVLRNIFVGILFAVGTALYMYKGYSKGENYALNLASVMAFGVALFPMAKHPPIPSNGFTIHGAFSAAFFVSIAYVCVFCADETLRLIKSDPLKRRYYLIYRILGGTMMILAAVAWLLRSSDYLFWAEAGCILVFSGYWCVKNWELR